MSEIISFSNDDIYINEKTLSWLMQTLLNEAYGSEKVFYVTVDENFGRENPAPVHCMLKYELSHYSLRHTGCVLANIRLEIKVPAERENGQLKERVTNTVNRILGSSSFSFNPHIDGYDGVYECWANFKKSEGGTTIENINAEYTSTITLRGTLNMTQEGGGVLGDRIFTFILLEDKQYQVIMRASGEGVSYTVEAPLQEGSFTNNTEYVSRVTAKQISVLYADDEICRILRDYAKGEESAEQKFLNEDGKPVLRLVEQYPDRTFQTDYFITAVQENRECGALCSITLSLTRCRE